MSTPLVPLPLSVAIVCRNSDATIGRTLDSIRELVGAGAGGAQVEQMGEIVAVDSGSTDGTLGLLERAGARIIRSEWLGHVRTKQLALETCARPWVLSLDSDESLLPELAASIRRTLQQDDPAVGGYMLNRKVFYRGRPLNFAWQPEWRLRLVRRGMAAWGGIDPHDKLDLTPQAREAGKLVGRLTGNLRHDSFETFERHLGKQLGYSRLSAEGMLREGRRSSLLRMALSPCGALLKQLIVKQAWRDGYAGWLAAGTQAAGTLMKHMMLLEMDRANRRD